MEVYLLERGCTKGAPRLSSRSHFLNSDKILKRYVPRNRRNLIPNCSNFVKAVFEQLGSVSINLKIKNLSNGDHVTTEENASRIVFNSSPPCAEESSKLFLEEEVKFPLTDEQIVSECNYRSLCQKCRNIDSLVDFHDANRLMQMVS